MKFFARVLALLGLGVKGRGTAVAGDPLRPYIAPETLREPRVYRGGRHHTRNSLRCPKCLTTTAAEAA
jgi:hypothetical protein